MRPLFDTITIVGVGLIGGSIGLAAKKRGVARHVRGFGRDAGKLQEARTLGAIDAFHLDLPSAVAGAELVLFCTPVNKIAEQIQQAGPHCASGAILSDAGSTKEQLVRAVERELPGHVQFVGAHPLAGSEKKGADHAQADLFVDRWTVLTPTAATGADALERVRRFWTALGSRVRVMSATEHDAALAMTSHLPHLLAAALAGMLPDDLRDLTATGFRDTTRIAAGDPAVWTPIFEHNSAALLAALDRFEELLHAYRAALQSNDLARIDSLLGQSKKVRDALGS